MKRFPLHRRRVVRRADAPETKPLPTSSTPPDAPPDTIAIGLGMFTDLASEVEAMFAKATMDAAKALVGDDSAAVAKRLNDVNEALHNAIAPLSRQHGTTLFTKIAISAYLHTQIGNLPVEQQTGILALGRKIANDSVRRAGGYDALSRERDPKVN